MFDELNRKFDIGAPALFANPIDYLASSLEMSLPEAEGTAGDPYAFKPLIERLRRVAQDFAKTTAPRGIEATLDRLRELMRESHYSEAVDLLATIVPAKLSKLDESAKKEVLGAARLAGTALRAKLGADRPTPNLASILVFDAKVDESLALGSSRLAWLVGSRTGQVGFETTVRGKRQGAFTAQLVETLRDPVSDRDCDGRISFLEATIEASRRMTKEMITQSRWPQAVPPTRCSRRAAWRRANANRERFMRFSCAYASTR